eukprot:jgi/Psemu1/32810/gm1.32810_g
MVTTPGYQVYREIYLAALAEHLSLSPGTCFSYYNRCVGLGDFTSSLFVRSTKKKEDTIKQFGLTTIHNSPMRAVVFLICQKFNDNNSDSDDNCFPHNDEDEEEGINCEVTPPLSVVRKGNMMPVDVSPPDSNTAMTTPIAGRHVSDKVKEKIKLMKIMWNYLIKTRATVMKELYGTVAEIEGDDFQPQLIDWGFEKPIGVDIAGPLHSLLTNITLIKEDNLSFLHHADNPALPVCHPELRGNIDTDELHHGQCSPDTWETIYFHPTGSHNKGDEWIDNVNNLHSSLQVAFESLKEACNLTEEEMVGAIKFAVVYFIGDTPQHDQLCGLYQNTNTKMINRHHNCPMALGNNACAKVLKAPMSMKTGKMKEVSKDNNAEECHSVHLWKTSDFTNHSPWTEEGVRLEYYFKDVSHQSIASTGERLQMHQLGCTKRAVETFYKDFLGNNTRLLGDMDRVVSYFGAVVQRQFDCDFPQTKFLESIHIANKKESTQYRYITMMFYIQMLALLSAKGCKHLMPKNHNKSGEQEQKM